MGGYIANFKTLSRYTNAIVDTNSTGQLFLPLRSPLGLPSSPDDIYVTVTQELLLRPDLVSSNAYGIPDLWWVIYEYNNISDPLFSLTIGQTLVIPELNRVLNALNSLGLA